LQIFQNIPNSIKIVNDVGGDMLLNPILIEEIKLPTNATFKIKMANIKATLLSNSSVFENSD